VRNRFGGTCYRCQEWCAPGEGHFEKYSGGWRVQHASCAIRFRGQPDDERKADTLAELQRRALGTGKRAQRARRELRDRGLTTQGAAVRSPIDIAIMKAVRCLTCGAGFDECDCAKKLRDESIEREYQRLMSLSDEDLLAECKSLGIEIKS
jgi:hypothetical protein